MRRRAFLGALTGFAGTTAGCGFLDGGAEADPSHKVRVDNDADATRSLSLTVSIDGAEVYDRELSVQANAERVVYDTERAEPNGIQRVTVEVTAGDQRGSAEIRTDACHGDVTAHINDDGRLSVFYSVC